MKNPKNVNYILKKRKKKNDRISACYIELISTEIGIETIG